jgi:hypothetical protein
LIKYEIKNVFREFLNVFKYLTTYPGFKRVPAFIISFDKNPDQILMHIIGHFSQKLKIIVQSEEIFRFDHTNPVLSLNSPNIHP